MITSRLEKCEIDQNLRVHGQDERIRIYRLNIRTVYNGCYMAMHTHQVIVDTLSNYFYVMYPDEYDLYDAACHTIFELDLMRERL